MRATIDVQQEHISPAFGSDRCGAELINWIGVLQCEPKVAVELQCLQFPELAKAFRPELRWEPRMPRFQLHEPAEASQLLRRPPSRRPAPPKGARRPPPKGERREGSVRETARVGAAHGYGGAAPHASAVRKAQLA